MFMALTLLMIALALVLYRDRNFWFPDTEEAESDQQDDAPAVGAAQPPAIAKTSLPGVKPKHRAAPEKKPGGVDAFSAPAGPVASVTNRTVLPPLEVEVVAGDERHTVRPGSNSIRVDLRPGVPAQPTIEPATTASSSSGQSAAEVTSDAAERVQMSAGSADIVIQSVRPDYPLLARQMKVQGSVILQALIGKDGIIQNLHVMSGPPILAMAAREAVKQWHFKPHYQGVDRVETQATITVNFTISTN
jgi:TonB family protein